MTEINTVLNSFNENKQRLVSILEDQDLLERKKLVENYTLDEEYIEKYYDYVYKNADPEHEGSCDDLLVNGSGSLSGVLSNISKGFKHMATMYEQGEITKADDFAGQLHNKQKLFNLAETQLPALHDKSVTLGPTIEEPSFYGSVILTLNDLDTLLKELSEKSN